MKRVWRVAYDIVTPASAEHGDVADRGIVIETTSLAEAVREFWHDAERADEYPIRCPRGFYSYVSTDYHTGAEETRYLAVPESITCASRLRLARLLGLEARS